MLLFVVIKVKQNMKTDGLPQLLSHRKMEIHFRLNTSQYYRGHI